MKLYDLRHMGIVFVAKNEVETKLATGNLTHGLARQAVRVGHGSLTVFLATYVGTALFLLV